MLSDLFSEILVYGLLTGAFFGLLGAGGSILIWPLLVVVLGHSEKIALIESLLIVGSIAAGGCLPYIIHKQIDYKAILFMGLTGMLGAICGAWLGKETNVTTHRLIFIIIVWVAAWSMLKGPVFDGSTQSSKVSSLTVTCFIGFFIGLCSGFSSVGGGFLLVPALVVFLKLPMHKAIGTSLTLITLNTFSGFTTLYLSNSELFNELNYPLMAIFACFGTLGSLLGAFLAQSIPQKKLRFCFGVMLIAVGCFFSYDLLKQLFIKLR